MHNCFIFSCKVPGFSLPLATLELPSFPIELGLDPISPLLLDFLYAFAFSNASLTGSIGAGLGSGGSCEAGFVESASESGGVREKESLKGQVFDGGKRESEEEEESH